MCPDRKNKTKQTKFKISIFIQCMQRKHHRKAFVSWSAKLFRIELKININSTIMADILKPDLVWIEGRCYRSNDSTTEIGALQEHDLYENEIHYNEESGEDDDDFEVTLLDNSRYCGYIHVSKHYIGSIIGKKGATKMRIERDTNTNIKIPKQGQTGDIGILGPTEANVKAARRRINMIVMSSRNKQRPTHFISIPMNKPEIMKNFEMFKENVLKECSGRGLEEEIFVKAETLHLTIGVMCLMDNEERLEASKLLAEAKEQVILPLLRDTPLTIRVRGLSYMNDEPSQIAVLYSRAEVDHGDPGALQTMADSIANHFYKKGFMKRDHGRDDVKLHVTLMNTKNKNKREDGEVHYKLPRETFDGSEVLAKYKDFDFGALDVTEIHLSYMSQHTMGPDGFYQPTSVISVN